MRPHRNKRLSCAGPHVLSGESRLDATGEARKLRAHRLPVGRTRAAGCRKTRSHHATRPAAPTSLAFQFGLLPWPLVGGRVGMETAGSLTQDSEVTCSHLVCDAVDSWVAHL